MPAHPETDPARTPFGICLAAGAVVVAVTAMAAAAASSAPVRLSVVAATAAGVAACADDARAALATAGLSYLVFNGFLVNRYGELTWDGWVSAGHLAVLGSATGLGLAWRLLGRLRAWATADRKLADLLDDGICDKNNKV